MPTFRPSHPPRVLVVDDEAAVRELVARMLEPQAYEVLLAAGGAEAWSLAQRAAESRPLDLVISDVVMPGLGGLALAAKLKTLPNPPALLLISGHDQGSGDTGLPFLAKPFGADDLTAIVRELLSAR